MLLVFLSKKSESGNIDLMSKACHRPMAFVESKPAVCWGTRSLQSDIEERVKILGSKFLVDIS